VLEEVDAHVVVSAVIVTTLVNRSLTPEILTFT